jgi:hypothetical protein
MTTIAFTVPETSAPTTITPGRTFKLLDRSMARVWRAGAAP